MLTSLFRLFILQQREGISSLKELYQAVASPEAAPAIAQKYDVPLAEARRLHLNIQAFLKQLLKNGETENE